MKKPADKARAIIKATGGESLIEGIVSILVFTILIASVTMMLMVSLRITGASTVSSRNAQDEANAVLSGNASVTVILPSGDTDVIDVARSGDTVELAIGSMSIIIPVTVYSTNNYTAFNP